MELVGVVSEYEMKKAKAAKGVNIDCFSSSKRLAISSLYN